MVGNGRTHDIGLCPYSYQAVDVFADGDQHFASHVSALLGTRSLIFNVYASSSFLDEHLGEFHDRRETSVTRVCICNDGSEEVCVCNIGALGFRSRNTFFLLFTVME